MTRSNRLMVGLLGQDSLPHFLRYAAMVANELSGNKGLVRRMLVKL